MRKICVFLVFHVVLSISVSFASQPILPKHIKIENQKYYELLASKHSILKKLFENWQLKSVNVKEYTINDILLITINFDVPVDSSPLGIAYKYSFIMKFVGDSLINSIEIRKMATIFKEILSRMENHPAVRVFYNNSNVNYAHLSALGHTHILELHSTKGDTLVYENKWPYHPKIDQIYMLSFTNIKLLDQLELFLSKFPIPQVTEFRTQVGIGYARLYRNHLFVSSGNKYGTKNTCFSTYHSGRLITSFKLPTSFDWHGFRFYTKSMSCFQGIISKQIDLDCQSKTLADSSFVIMNYQQNSLPRRIYLMLNCENKTTKFISTRVSLTEPNNYDFMTHGHEVRDSFHIECRWDL